MSATLERIAVLRRRRRSIDRTKAQLDEFEARIRKQWGKLTDDEIREARGSTDELIAKIQKKYAEGRDAISSKIDELRSG